MNDGRAPVTKVYSIDGIVPVVDPSAFVHPTAVLIGDVIVGAGAYIGPCASLRGDFGRIVVGVGVNVQDGCVLHCFPGRETLVEENGHIGHGAVLHGCIVRRDAMVGINAIVMDDAIVGEAAIVAAGCFIKAGMEIPPRVLVAGIPGRIVRDLAEDEVNRKLQGTRLYQELARRSLATMQLVDALPAAEPGRRRFPQEESGS